MNTILWTRVDGSGHESARLDETPRSSVLSGSAVFVEDALPVRLDYEIACDGEWKTRSAIVHGWIGDRPVEIAISAGDGRWMMNESRVNEVAGCIDVDLNFSPSTNLLPVRRLGLAVGESAQVRAAWLRFPTLRLEVLEQTYRRLAPDVYEYVSGNFTARITVNETGLPIDYAGVWRAVAPSPIGH